MYNCIYIYCLDSRWEQRLGEVKSLSDLGTLPLRLECLRYGANLVWGEEIIDRKLIGAVRMENPTFGALGRGLLLAFWALCTYKKRGFRAFSGCFQAVCERFRPLSHLKEAPSCTQVASTTCLPGTQGV